MTSDHPLGWARMSSTIDNEHERGAGVGEVVSGSAGAVTVSVTATCSPGFTIVALTPREPSITLDEPPGA